MVAPRKASINATQNFVDIRGIRNIARSMFALPPLTANQNDLDLKEGSLVKLSSTLSVDISGIKSTGLEGREISLLNSGVNAISILNESGLSLAANRILTGSGGAVTIPANSFVTLVYDIVISRWRVSTASGASGAAGGGFRVVTTEAELDDAVADLSAGGTIQLAGAITLTSNKSWDLSMIRVVSDKSHASWLYVPPRRIILNGFKITNIGSGCYFDGVCFSGGVAGPGESQTAFLFTEGATGATTRIYTFFRCDFRSLVGSLNTIPVFDFSGLNGGTYAKNVVHRLDSCIQSSVGVSNPPHAGLICFIGTTSSTTGIGDYHMFVNNCSEGHFSAKSRWGGRKTNSGPGTGNGFIFHDDTCQIVEYTNFYTKICTIGSAPYLLVTAGAVSLDRETIGQTYIFNNAALATLALPAPASFSDLASGDIGAMFHAICIGAGNVSISIPAGFSLRWQGVLYTATTLTIAEKFGKMDFFLAAANLMVMTTSWDAFGFVQTASKVVASTVAETTLVAAGVGSMTLPANKLAVGKTLFITAGGFISDTATPTFRVRVKIGGVLILDTGAVTFSGTIANNQWSIVAAITCRTAGVGGTVIGQGSFREEPDNRAGMANLAPVVVDTTIANLVDVTWEWGTSDPANTITCTNLIADVK
jgi:hypothetical protein